MVPRPRGKQTELINPRTKSVLGVECSCAMHRQGDSFIAKAEGSSYSLSMKETLSEIESSLEWPLPFLQRIESQPHQVWRVFFCPICPEDLETTSCSCVAQWRVIQEENKQRQQFVE